MIAFLLLAASQAFDWTLSPKNSFLSFNSTIIVPQLPSHSQNDATYFLWPGLQTNNRSSNFLPIGFGVLQPVLTFGRSCAPNQPRNKTPYRGWYVSGLYVNPSGTVPGYQKCNGGPIMDVLPDDVLVMQMNLYGTVWSQVITRLEKPCLATAQGNSTATGCQVTFDIDMRNQSQTRAELKIELYFKAVVDFPVVFRGFFVYFLDISLKTRFKVKRNITKFCTHPKPDSYEVCEDMFLDSTGTLCTISKCVFSPVPQSILNNTSDSEEILISPDEILDFMPNSPPPEEDEVVEDLSADEDDENSKEDIAGNEIDAAVPEEVDDDIEERKGKSISLGMIIGICVGVLLFVCVVLYFGYMRWIKRKAPLEKPYPKILLSECSQEMPCLLPRVPERACKQAEFQ